MHALAQSLPVLRPDVEFLRGSDDANGAPQWVIHDPLRGTFERATWVQGEILRRLRSPTTIESVLKDLAACTAIKVRADDVARLYIDAVRRGLTVPAFRHPDMEIGHEVSADRQSVWDLASHRLLFRRFPLLRPDAFVTRTLATARRFWSVPARMVYLMAGLTGVVLLLQRFDEYASTLPHYFSVRGGFAITLTVLVVKVIHEFAHAYTAKSFGVRVRSMGVVLFFFLPIAYTDVTDAWRLRSRRQRVLISFAGVLAETILAGIALCAWAVSPPGIIRGICFVVSSASLASTLLINLNPAIRADGYYILSDMLGVDNLRARATAVTRWTLWWWMLGYRSAPPEPGLTRRRLALMMAFTFYSTAYRLVLYFGLAIMFSHFVDRGVGAALLLAIVYGFIVRPALREGRAAMHAWRRMGSSGRTILALAGFALVMAWLILPLPRRKSVPAITRPAVSQNLYAPHAGVIRGIHASRGTRVTREQTLYVVESRALKHDLERARLETARIDTEVALIRNQASGRSLLPRKTEELARAQARQQSLQAALNASCIKAEIDGTLVTVDPSLRDGVSVGKNQILGRVVASRPVVLAFVPHALGPDCVIGTRVRFQSDALPASCWGRVTNIDVAGEPSRTHAGRRSVAESIFRVAIELDATDGDVRLGQTGTAWFWTAPRSHLLDAARTLFGALVRESSF